MNDYKYRNSDRKIKFSILYHQSFEIPQKQTKKSNTIVSKKKQYILNWICFLKILRQQKYTYIHPPGGNWSITYFQKQLTTKLMKLSSHEHIWVTTTQAKNWTLATLQFSMCLFPQILAHCSYQKVSPNTIDHFCIF